jgi:hypothetical protein
LLIKKFLQYFRYDSVDVSSGPNDLKSVDVSSRLKNLKSVDVSLDPDDLKSVDLSSRLKNLKTVDLPSRPNIFQIAIDAFRDERRAQERKRYGNVLCDALESLAIARRYPIDLISLAISEQFLSSVSNASN